MGFVCSLAGSTTSELSPSSNMNYTGAIKHINLSCSDMIKGRAFYRFLLADLMGYKEGREESYGTNYTRKTGESNTFFFWLLDFLKFSNA